PHVLDSAGLLTVDLEARDAAENVVSAAATRARRIAPDLRITSAVFPGRASSALVNEAHRAAHPLVVLDRSSRDETPLLRRLTRRTTASIAMIRLTHRQHAGPSAGRVVVGVDDDQAGPAVGFAFRAARRRGLGLTIVHAPAAIRWDDVAETVGLCAL